MLSLRLIFKNLDGLRRSFFALAVFSVLDGFASLLIPVVLAKAAPSASIADAPRWIVLLFGLFPWLPVGFKALRRGSRTDVRHPTPAALLRGAPGTVLRRAPVNALGLFSFTD